MYTPALFPPYIAHHQLNLLELSICWHCSFLSLNILSLLGVHLVLESVAKALSTLLLLQSASHLLLSSFALSWKWEWFSQSLAVFIKSNFQISRKWTIKRTNSLYWWQTLFTNVFRWWFKNVVPECAQKF